MKTLKETIKQLERLEIKKEGQKELKGGGGRLNPGNNNGVWNCW